MANSPIQEQPQRDQPQLPAGTALPAVVADISTEEVRLEANSRRGPLALSIAQPLSVSKPDLAVISVHGFCSNRRTQFSKRSETHALSNSSLSCRVGLRGQDPDSGERVDQFTLSKGVADLKVTLDFLRERGIQKFVLAANSVGAQLALLVARDNKDISNLVLFAPLTDAWGAMSRQFDSCGLTEKWMSEGTIEVNVGVRNIRVKLGDELYRDAKSIRENLDYSGISADVSVIFAADDQVVPPAVMRPALNTLAKDPEVILIDKADHAFTCTQAQHLAMQRFDGCLRKALQVN